MLFRKIVALVGLAAWMEFCLAKANPNSIGAGWVLLPLFGVCTLAVIALSPWRDLSIRKSTIALTAFMIWFSVRLVLDSPSAELIFGFLIGSYQNGVGFGLLAGASVAVLVASLAGSTATGSGPIRWVLAILLLQFIATVQLTYTVLATAGFQSELLIVENDSYQRSGALLTLNALIFAQIAGLTLVKLHNQGRTILSAIVVVCSSFQFVFLTILSQFLGSNSGALCCILVGAVFWTIPVRLVLPKLGTLGRVIARQSNSFILIMGGIATIPLVIWSRGISLPEITMRFRMFGFDEGTIVNNSIFSRIDLLVNFPTQFEHAMLFGDFFVDQKTTGAGTYIHSLISILPHLGIVGAALCLLYLLLVNRELKQRIRLCRKSDFAQEHLESYNYALLVAIGVVAFLTAFFTWVPLWFALGLLAPPICGLIPNSGPR